jgi:hypothetical protein
MASATHDITKRKRAPVTGTPVLVRLQPDQLGVLDAWIAKQPKPVSRPEAIRAMVAAALLLMGD